MTAVVRRSAGLFMAALLLLNGACYAYLPLAAGVAPSGGDYVRVRLNGTGSADLASSLGPGVEWAEGTISERRPDGTLVIGVVQVRLRDGFDRFWSGSNSVVITPAQIAELQRKTLDRGKSRTAAIAFSGLLVAIAFLALGSGGAGGDGGDPGGQPPP